VCIASLSVRRVVPPVRSTHEAAIARAVSGTLVTLDSSGSACSHSSTNSSAPPSSGLASSGHGAVRNAAKLTSSCSPTPYANIAPGSAWPPSSTRMSTVASTLHSIRSDSSRSARAANSRASEVTTNRTGEHDRPIASPRTRAGSRI
jgi:hypothetical protein